MRINIVSWVEIPVKQMARAINFYETVLALDWKKIVAGNSTWRGSPIPKVVMDRGRHWFSIKSFTNLHRTE